VSINERPLILTIETATRAGSVSLNAGAQLIASRVGSDQTSHSTNLLQDIGSLLKEAGIDLHRVDLFAAASGPGSFTGLRIGLATVKSFAATLERPCLGVPTLTAIAYGAGISRQTMALLPAGRGELFAQLLRVDENGEVTPLTEAAHLAPGRVLDMAKKIRPLKWAGEGAHLQREAVRDFAERQEIAFLDEAFEGAATLREEAWTLAPPTQILAASVAQLALRRFNSGETAQAQDLRAIYVRASDAELKERCQEQRVPS
jgi:tRNA threonylcarbamoyladenosine biosynthesis protein TsaB